MSEDTSLTDAVKLAAGISLSKAVKDVAGRRTWFVDEVLDARDDAAAARSRRLGRAASSPRCGRLAAARHSHIGFLHAASTSTVLDGQRGRSPPRTAASRSSSAIPHTGTRPGSRTPRTMPPIWALALKKLGFHVLEGFDLDKAAFDAKIRDFAAALKGAEVGVFFYAGHGMQVAGQNYLVPVDAKLTTVLGAGRRRWCAWTSCTRRWSARRRPISSSSMHAGTIRSRAIWPAPWARGRSRSGAALPPSKAAPAR